MPNGHGGKRKGAGRPLGSRNERSEKLVEFLDRDENNPFEALTRVMRKAAKNGDDKLVIECAKILAPYHSPKLRPLDDTGEHPPSQIVVRTNFPLPGEYWLTGKPVPPEIAAFVDGEGPYPYDLDSDDK